VVVGFCGFPYFPPLENVVVVGGAEGPDAMSLNARNVATLMNPAGERGVRREDAAAALLPVFPLTEPYGCAPPPKWEMDPYESTKEGVVGGGMSERFESRGLGLTPPNPPPNRWF
jgi:hypothetical protein